MILKIFLIRKKTLATANVAKKRLKTIISKTNTTSKLASYNLINLKNDLIKVIRQHIHEPKDILVQLKKQDEYTFILECNVFFLNKDIQ